MSASTGSGTGALTRREALRAGAGLCGVALLAAGLSQAAAAPAGAATQARSGQVRIRISDYPELKRIGGAAVIPSVRGIPAAVVRTGRSAYIALDLRCTHQGTPVRLSGSAWACPSHGSQFATDGAVTRGPAGSPLRRLPVRRKRGILIVG